MPDNLIKRFESDPDWQLVRQHILANIDSLNTLSGINFLDKESAAIEGRARELAHEKLNDILKPFTKVADVTNNPQLTTSQRTGVV